MSAFMLPLEQYRRDIDILSAWKRAISTFISDSTTATYQEAYAYLEKQMQPGGRLQFHDPEILYLEKKTRGNRLKYESTFLEYLQYTQENDHLMAPTFTTYLQPHVKKSLIAKYIQTNKQLRKVYKNQQHEAEMLHDYARYSFCAGLQTSIKVKNNSVSGAHSSPYNSLYCKSAHSTLTSGCRAATSYSNANNEKLLAGNRHYWCPNVVLTDLINHSQYSDRASIAQVMQRYQLHVPSVEDVMACINSNTRDYWRSDISTKSIELYVKTLDPLARASFLYNGDLFHMAKHNPLFVREFLNSVSDVDAVTKVDTEMVANMIDGDTLIMGTLISSDYVGGRLIKDVKKNTPDDYNVLMATCLKIHNGFDAYSDFVGAFVRPNVLTPSIAYLPNMIRKAVVTSDTDSTISTCQWWSEWFCGREKLFSRKGFDIAYTMTYLVSQTVKHLLAQLSVNFGVHKDRIGMLSMKNEYFFPLYSLTTNAKHYFNYTSACEGNVYEKFKLDVKGVGLRSSNAPPRVTSDLHKYMMYIMDKTINEGGLTSHELYNPVVCMEHSILHSINSGKYEYMKTQQIKQPSSYVNGEEAAGYQYYMMWLEVFSPKYGFPDAPPYRAVKISLDLHNRTRLKAWLDSIEDQAFKQRMEAWLTRTGKTSLTTLMLPEPALMANGVPKEVISAVASRKLLADVMRPFYLTIEAAGISMLNDNLTRLASDEIHPARSSLVQFVPETVALSEWRQAA